MRASSCRSIRATYAQIVLMTDVSPRYDGVLPPGDHAPANPSMPSAAGLGFGESLPPPSGPPVG